MKSKSTRDATDVVDKINVMVWHSNAEKRLLSCLFT